MGVAGTGFAGCGLVGGMFVLGVGILFWGCGGGCRFAAQVLSGFDGVVISGGSLSEPRARAPCGSC